jgi:hypothetical protein
LRFHWTESLSKDRTFNAEYYRENILAALIPLHAEGGGKELILHADNARANMAGKYRAFVCS